MVRGSTAARSETKSRRRIRSPHVTRSGLPSTPQCSIFCQAEGLCPPHRRQVGCNRLCRLPRSRPAGGDLWPAFYTDFGCMAGRRRAAAPGCLLRLRGDSRDGDRASTGCSGGYPRSRRPPADPKGHSESVARADDLRLIGHSPRGATVQAVERANWYPAADRDRYLGRIYSAVIRRRDRPCYLARLRDHMRGRIRFSWFRGAV